MNFIQSFDNKTILIPLLQRDYVQGGQEDVISPFIDSLLGKECDLNYIYGYEEDGCFVPVDGQQRLITLWLLYLYLYSRKRPKERKFSVRMKFASREYAEDFCENLSEHLKQLLTCVKDNVSLDEIIIDQNWFIRSWLSNASVKNMLGTIKVIHRRINETNFSSIWNNLVESSVPSINFAFLQMNDNGLDDDIYIKMNGRGRKLSAFENLKSYMDEHVSDLTDAREWKTNMDNAWADVFWSNRNMYQDYPEEIDDEQLYCLYNLLILYHTVNGHELQTTLTNIKEETPHLYEDLMAFLDKDEKSDEKDVISSIIVRLQKAGNFPLVWFERLHLLSNGFYEFALKKLNVLDALSQKLNQMTLYIGASSFEKTTKTYQLCMCEGSFARTLPLLYALLAYQEGETKLFHWMRTMRNLILNTDIDSIKLPSIMKAIDELSSLCKEQKIYDVLLSDNAKDNLGKFNKDQVEEEIMKASAPEYCYEQMVKLENGRFFSGRIGILFRLLPYDEQVGYDTMSQENIRAYSVVLLELFDGGEKGVSDKFDDDRFLLRRALMSFSPYYFGRWRSGWSFNYGINEWRDYINNGKNDEVETFKLLLKELLVPAFKEGKDLYITLSEHVEAISKKFESDIIVKDDNSFRYYFIRYPEIWEYMSTKRCSWNDNNFDIVLKKSNSNNSNRMELRTMSLYLDYKNNKDYIPDRDGWKLYIWPKEKSCFYFERKTLIGDNRRTIAIDVHFYHDNGRRFSEDCYSFDLFIRPLHHDAENEEEKLAFADEDYRQNIDLFSAVIPDQMSLFVRKDDGRLHSNKPYSRHELKQVLKNILGGINNALKAAEENADAPVV